MPEPVVLYEERGGIAIITLNRPAKMNTLTEEVVQGVADGIDRASASRPVRSIVVRGAGPALTGGYDLNADNGVDIEAGWANPVDATARSLGRAPGIRCATCSSWATTSSAS